MDRRSDARARRVVRARSCWAYRAQPPWRAYSHDHFVQSLTSVMLSVDLVVWLPRSRAHSDGQYQYARAARPCSARLAAVPASVISPAARAASQLTVHALCHSVVVRGCCGPRLLPP
jgi:hypothetical protein